MCSNAKTRNGKVQIILYVASDIWNKLPSFILFSTSCFQAEIRTKTPFSSATAYPAFPRPMVTSHFVI